MPTDEQRRNDFIAYLRQLKQSWEIVKEAEIAIIKTILGHKGSELVTYIARFKVMINWMIKGVKNKPDRYSRTPPADGECIDYFVGASVTTQDYTSNFALRLFFSRTTNEIYKFEVLR